MDEVTQRTVMAEAWAGVAWWALACVVLAVAGHWALGWLVRRDAAAQESDRAEQHRLMDAFAREVAAETLAAGYPVARVEVLTYGDESPESVPQVRVVLSEPSA